MRIERNRTVGCSGWKRSLELTQFSLFLKARPKFKVSLGCSGICPAEFRVSPGPEILQPL